MQKVISKDRIQDYSDHIKQQLIDYIADGQVETYESFENVSIIAFDWYNIKDTNAEPAQILVYFDRKDLFYICEN